MANAPAEAVSATPYMLAVVSPLPDVGAFLREALWLAEERGAELVVALREESSWRLSLLSLHPTEDVAKLMDRWEMRFIRWRSDADISKIITGTGGFIMPEGVIMGPRRRFPWQGGVPRAVAANIVQAARQNHVEVFTDLAREREQPDFTAPAWRLDQLRPWYHEYVLSAFAVSFVAIIVSWLDRTLPEQSLAILFLVAVIYSAAAYGFAAAAFTSLMSVALYDYFFADPRYAFNLGAPENVLLILLFLVVAAITSNLAGGLRHEAAKARRQAREARALFQLTRDMAIAGDSISIYRAIVRQCDEIFESESALLTPYTGGTAFPDPRARTAALQVTYPTDASFTQEDIEAARWSFSQALPAGVGTTHFSEAGAYFIPLETSDGIVAVLALRGLKAEQVKAAAFQRVVGSISRLTAIAVERTLRKQELENARVFSQTEGLRSALLSAIAHDFGTPLASIIGSSSSLLSYGSTYSPAVTHELLSTIMEEAERLNRFVKNVLQMNRLEAGVMAPRLQWADVEDLVSTSLDAAHRRLENHEIYVDVESKLPLINVDFVLMESVLVNVLDNAAKYSPSESSIQITARRENEDVLIDVIDSGRGIAPDDLGAVFDKFYRAKHRDRTVPGTGLGLAICKGIVDSHGGSIEALSEGLGHGTTIRIRLPVRAPGANETAEI